MLARRVSGLGPAVISIASIALAFGAPSLFAAPRQSTDATAVTTPRIAEPAQAGVPRLIQFNGTLKDAASRPVSGVASVTFAIYNEQDNGTALWTETQNVLADASGHYSVLLGAATTKGVPADLFGTGESRWLGVTIARQPESPRVLLASVPYALKAGDADTLGGLPASSYVTTQQLAASNARPATTFLSGGGTAIVAASGATTSGAAAGPITPELAQSSVIQANPTGAGTTDYIPLWTTGSNLGNSLLFQTGGKIGVGTTTPASTLDINGGEILRGGFYEYPQGAATASAGQPSHSFQWIASVFQSSSGEPINQAFGFRAVPFVNNSPNPSSTLDLFSGSGGPDGSLTDTGLSIDGHGQITFAPGQSFPLNAIESFTSIDLPATVGNGTTQINFGGSAFLTDLNDQSDVFLGYQSAGGGGLKQPSNGGNTAAGWQSLYSLTDGSRNTAFGEAALYSMQSAAFDTGIGGYALYFDANGGFNTAVGGYALYNVAGNYNSGTIGIYNTAVGTNAGQVTTTGSFNTSIGTNSGPGAATLSNVTAVGAAAQASISNALILGSTETPGSSVPAPNVGIGTSAPRSTMEVSSFTGSTFAAPGPILTLSNGSTDTPNGVAIDFDPAVPAGTLPFARIEASGQTAGAELDFFTNTNGSSTSGTLTRTLTIDEFGNISIPGSLYVTGEVQKGGGTFKIDDPIDPANKYLSHSFVESPDMMNIYNGNIVTDANGFATVEMPAWFEALNADFRYQLTVLGQFAQAIVASEMQDGKFSIRTDKPNVKVSWQVTGIRHDPYAVANRTPIEESKPASEQGRYLHPEVYGAGPDQRVQNAHLRASSIAPSGAPVSPINPAAH